MAGIPPEEIILTDNQAEVCELICQGLKDGEIGAQLNISRAAVLNRFKAALKKLGTKEMERRYHHITIREKIDYQLRNNAENLNIAPIEEIRSKDADKARVRREKTEVTTAGQDHALEKALGACDGDPAEALHKIMQLAKKAGVPPAVIDGLSNRVMKGIVEVDMMPENYKDEDLREEISTKIRMVLGHIDAATIGGAKLTDLSTIFKTLQEQMQLLDGKPTAILAVEDKQGLTDIAARMQAELNRRGITVNGSCEEVEGED
jgi:transcriptional regulator